jgi:hypothetical protein
MFILIGPHVKAFSDGNQTVCPTLKNKTTWIIYKKNCYWGYRRKVLLKLKFFIALNYLLKVTIVVFC